MLDFILASSLPSTINVLVSKMVPSPVRRSDTFDCANINLWQILAAVEI